MFLWNGKTKYMCMCIYSRIYTHMTCTCTRKLARTHMVHMNTYIHLHIYMYVDIYMDMYKYTYMSMMCTYMYGQPKPSWPKPNQMVFMPHPWSWTCFNLYDKSHMIHIPATGHVVPLVIDLSMSPCATNASWALWMSLWRNWGFHVGAIFWASCQLAMYLIHPNNRPYATRQTQHLPARQQHAIL